MHCHTTQKIERERYHQGYKHSSTVVGFLNSTKKGGEEKL